jgi:glycosyltransferase involved in cell wall biosynthesis
LQQLCRQLPDLQVLVVGTGPNGEEQALEKAARQAGFADQLVLAGWVEPQQLPDCLAAADAALYLFDDTLVNRTKCPAKLAELAAAGIPLVAERVGQIGDYLGHGTSGLLVEPGDTVGMVAAVEKLLIDRQLAQRFGYLAAQLIKTEFSWEKSAERLEQFYARVCKP